MTSQKTCKPLRVTSNDAEPGYNEPGSTEALGIVKLQWRLQLAMGTESNHAIVEFCYTEGRGLNHLTVIMQRNIISAKHATNMLWIVS